MKKRASIAFVLVALSPALAFAAPQDPPAAATGDDSAQALSDRGYDAYEKGDYPKAIEAYLASYKLVPSADILYNVASIYDKKLREPQLAVEFYRRHNAAPDAKPELIGKATARIAALSSPGGGASGGGSSSNSAEGGSSLRTVGVITGVVGVLGIGAGAITGLIAGKKHDDSGCSKDICTTQSGRDTEKSAATIANISTISFIGGGVLLAAGVVMYLVAPKSEKRAGFLAPTGFQAGSTSWGVVGRF